MACTSVEMSPVCVHDGICTIIQPPYKLDKRVANCLPTRQRSVVSPHAWATLIHVSRILGGVIRMLSTVSVDLPPSSA